MVYQRHYTGLLKTSYRFFLASIPLLRFLKAERKLKGLLSSSFRISFCKPILCNKLEAERKDEKVSFSRGIFL
jgi:hypothetical protein